MADDKTTKTPEQPVTDSGPGKETPPAPPKEPEKVSVSPEPEKKTEPEVKNPQVSVYNFAEIMKEKKVEERAAAPGVEKPDPAKAEKPEKQPEAPKKAEEKPKEPEQPKRRGRPPKANKDKDAAPKSKAPAQKPEKAVKKEPEKKTAPTIQAAPAPKGPEKPKDAPRRGKEQIVYIKLNELHAFKNHPFEVRDDEEMRAMVSSVKDKGVTQPAIVRPREDGGYEIVSGHRRQKASELAGYADMPCIVRNLTDDEAITQMVEDNLNQREEILPSERAKALKMQLEAIKHQGSRTSGQIDPKDAGKRSNEIVAERNKMAVKQVQRYIRLNELVPDLMKLMDEKKLGFTTAVELSYIGKKNQNYIAVAIDSQQSSPSQAQAKRMRELDEKKLLNGDVIDGIMMEDKKEVDKVILTGAELSKYFGKETTPREMKDQIIKLLDDWKHGKLDGCALLSPDQIEKLKASMASSWRSDPRPFESYQLTNNNAEIRRVKARIEQRSKQAQQEFSGWEFDGGRVEMNREDNRLQVFFDGKPDADTRAELKSSGFRWAPSVGAWQRQLTDNAIRAADRLECIKPLSSEKPSQLQKKPSILQTMREQGEKVQTEPEKKAPSGRDAER